MLDVTVRKIHLLEEADWQHSLDAFNLLVRVRVRVRLRLRLRLRVRLSSP